MQHRERADRLQSDLDDAHAAADHAGQRTAQLQAQVHQHADTATDLQALVDTSTAEAAQHRERAEQLTTELEQTRGAAASEVQRVAELESELQKTQQAVQDTADAKAAADDRAAALEAQLQQHTDTAATSAADLQALVDISTAEAAQHRDRAEQLQAELDQAHAAAADDAQRARERVTKLEARLQETDQAAQDAADAKAAEDDRVAAEATQQRDRAGQLEAELDEAREAIEQLRRALADRDDELEQVRRDAQAETRQLRLASLSDAAETEARAADHAELSAASLEPWPEGGQPQGGFTGLAERPAPRLEGRAQPQQISSSALRRAAAAGTANLSVPDRIRVATQSLPPQAIGGIVLIVLGLVVAVLFLTGQLG